MSEPAPPFFENAPPPWAARGLAWLLIGLTAAAIAAGALIEVPETARGSFVLSGGERVFVAPADGELVELGAGPDVRSGSVLARLSPGGTVTAPCTGYLVETLFLPGDHVVEGARLGRIACDGAPLEARVLLPAALSTRLRSGQRTWLEFDAYPSSEHGTWDAEVRTVVPRSEGVEVWLRITATRPEQLRAGMAGTARVKLGSRPALDWIRR